MATEKIQEVEETDGKDPKKKIRDNIDKINNDEDKTELSDNEINNFLEGKNTKIDAEDLWKILKKNFETEKGTLEEFRDSIWKICERILVRVEQGEKIDLNQWKILYFYLKQFHDKKDEKWTWRKIIQTIFEWDSWARYQEVVSDILGEEPKKHNKKNEIKEERQKWEDKKNEIGNRFDNLPRTKEIKDLKHCNKILEKSLDIRLIQDEENWLKEYKNEIETNTKILELDEEIKNRVEWRLNLEKCYQLLNKEDLEEKELDWLGEYNENWDIAPELKGEIEEKMKTENFKMCNRLLNTPDLSLKDIQWLKNYKENWTKEENPELVEKIDNKICEELLKSKNHLTQEDIQRLKNYKEEAKISKDITKKIDERICNEILEFAELSKEDVEWLNEYKNTKWLDVNTINRISVRFSEEILKTDGSLPLPEESIQILEYCKKKNIWDVEKIKARLNYEKKNKEIMDEVEQNINKNPLENLEKLGVSGNLKPNLTNLIKNWIKVPEDVNKITTDNIFRYLPIKKEVYTKDPQKSQNLQYIVYNFKLIIGKHLCYHKNYSLWYGLTPDKEDITTKMKMTLNNINEDNKMLEWVYNKLKELAESKKTLEQKLKEVLDINNHILFDLWLKTELTKDINKKWKKNYSEEDDKKIWEKLKYIFDKIYSITAYKDKLDTFKKNNEYINDIDKKYREGTKNEEENKKYDEVMSILWQIKDTTISRKLAGNKKKTKILSQAELERWKDIYIDMKRNNWIGVNTDLLFYSQWLRREAAKKMSICVKWPNYSESYEYFCEIYENSRNFYESIQKLNLPEWLDPQDYVNYMVELKIYAESIDYNAKTWYNQTKRKRDAIALEKLAVVYVDLWKKSTGGKKPQSFMWIPLRRDKSETHEIIRNTGIETLEDNIESFWNDFKSLDFQQMFWDVCWLVGWLLAASAALSSTWDVMCSWLAFYMWNKAGNVLGQIAWDYVVDRWIGKHAWLFGIEWRDKFDGLDADIGLATGIYKRENWKIVRAKTEWEAIVNMVFEMWWSYFIGIAAWNYNITPTSNPFKYAALDQFVKPLVTSIPESGIIAAYESAFNIWNYNWPSASEAMTNKFYEEYWTEWLIRKASNTFIATGLVKLYGNWCKDSPIIANLKEKLWNLEKHLNDKGIKINNLAEKCIDASKKWVKSLITSAGSRAVPSA